MIVLDTARFYRTICENAHLLTFSAARYLVDRSYFGGRELHGLVFEGERSCLLTDFMISLARRLSSIERDDLTEVLAIFSDLLALSLRANRRTATR